MKSAMHMGLRFPALALVATLAAAHGAWAEDGPPPFPGVAAESRRASALEKTSGTGPAEAAPAAPGEPGVPAVPVAAAQGREPGTERPAAGSRLLRALAESPRRDDMRAEDETAVTAAEGCPRGLLRRLLAGAAGEADALSALGIEREILSLCRERQEVLTGLFEAEAALRELRTPPEPAAEKAGVAPPPPARQIVPAARPGAPSPLRAALAAAEKADTRVAEPHPPRYAWFSIIGSAGTLRAGVTDGSGIWFVREGDALPGGTRIAAIAGRPPGVRITGTGETRVPGTLGPESGEATALPYRARPGDGP